MPQKDSILFAFIVALFLFYHGFWLLKLLSYYIPQLPWIPTLVMIFWSILETLWAAITDSDKGIKWFLSFWYDFYKMVTDKKARKKFDEEGPKW
jgi:hypothetical protein